MGWLGDALTDWAKELLVPAVEEQINGLFDATNEQVSTISVQIGKTPQSWNGDVFNMIKALSDTVILPIAGAVLAFCMTLELIQMVTEKNNLQDIDTWIFFRWVFRAAASILIVSNAWNIVMGIFSAAQSIVNRSASLIGTQTNLGPNLSGLHDTLMSMNVGPLLGLFLQGWLVRIATYAISIIIMCILYARMFEIYLVTAIGPIPLATTLNKEWGSMGQNYLRTLLALAFQGVLIILCVAVYYVVLRTVSFSSSIADALWACLGYSILLAMILFKTSAMAKSVFNAH